MENIVTPLNGPKHKGAKVNINGKIYYYWQNNTTNIINTAMITFDKKFESMNINDGVVMLSLKDLKSYQELYTAIGTFMQIIKTNSDNIHFEFIVENQNEQNMAELLGNNLGLHYTINNVNKEKMNEVEDNLKNQNFSASGTTETIIANDGQKYTVNNEKNTVYENIGLLSIEEQKLALLQEWQRDQFMSRRMQTMTKEEIDRFLTETVTNNLTNHRLETSNNLTQDAHGQVGSVAIDNATQKDGRIAVIGDKPNIAIVQNNPSNTSKYSVVENQSNNNIQVSEAQVQNTTINSGGINNDYSSNYNPGEMVEAGVNIDNETDKELTNQFYVDNDYNVYDNNGNILGRIGQDGYLIDYTNNALYKNGQMLGYLGDINDMGKTPEQLKQERANVKVRRLEKPQEKSAAFVSLPIIIFILSAILLLVSALLLFVLD